MRDDLVGRARELRRDQTKAEARLWRLLRNRQLGGWKWKRQQPIGPFIVDFYCAEAALVVELDGGQHATPEALRYDVRRTAFLEERGLRVLRFWNMVVGENPVGLCEVILAACGGQAPHPSRLQRADLSPEGRG